jgi:hypothetical protein
MFTLDLMTHMANVCQNEVFSAPRNRGCAQGMLAAWEAYSSTMKLHAVCAAVTIKPGPFEADPTPAMLNIHRRLYAFMPIYHSC